MRAAVLLFTAILVACSGKQWSASHPHYRESPDAGGEIALVGLHRAIVITRDKWFSKNLDIPRDSVYAVLGAEAEKAFAGELRKTRYPNIVLWPDSAYESFPGESIRLDSRIFVKGNFPAQGKTDSMPGATAPRHVILIHEITIGLDLSRDDFYDYALINRETPEKRTSNSLTVILAYTLWDNEKQRSLHSAVSEIPLDIRKGISPGDIGRISALAADALVSGIDGGVR